MNYKKKKIVHIAPNEKFIPSFIDFVNEHFHEYLHIFILLGKKEYKYGLKEQYLVQWLDKKIKVFALIRDMYTADKIIIHGLWSEDIVKLLYIQPWLLKKCFHIMWGGDFYFPEKQSWFKKQVIKKMGHFITYIEGDYQKIKKLYNAKGIYHECFMYPSNLYKEYIIKSKQDTIINIQVGNSGDPTNNHIEAFEKLKKFKNENINVYVPLSYGNEIYIAEVLKIGEEIFSNKFKPITTFIPLEEYQDFLSKIDIAIYAHKRQQGMGNIITLMGLGRKVFIRNDITPWYFFKNLGVEVYDFNTIDINLICDKIKQKNMRYIKNYFSEKNYVSQLKKIFQN